MLPPLLSQLIRAPVVDPARQSRGAMLQTYLVTLIAARIFLSIADLIDPDLVPVGTGGLAGVAHLLLLGGVLMVLRLGHVRTAAVATIALTILLVTSILAREGLATNGIMALGYMVPLAIAAVMLSRLSLVVVSAVVIGATAWVAFSEQAPQPFHPLAAIITFTLCAAIIALLLDRYRADWEKAIRTARANEERLQLVLQHAPIGMVLSDPDFVITYWNPAAEGIFGWSAAEMEGGPPDDKLIIPTLVPHIPAIRQKISSSVTTISVETKNLRKDGSEILCEWINTPLRDPDGTFLGFVAMVQDITERRRREIEAHELNSELERRVAERTAELAAKNRELEVFAYSVSHDLKAPLRGIDGYSRLLSEDFAGRLDGDGPYYIAMIRAAAANMGELIDDLLTYSRVERRAVQVRGLDLVNIVGQVVAEYGEQLAGVDLTVDLPPLIVRAEPEALSQALRNLLENALKFSRPVPAPTIAIGGERQGESGLIWVRDNGIGFSMEYHERIFELFQRLHLAEEYPGTGIGLAIVRKAVERMGGAVWATSTPGEGATFFLRLPLASKEGL